jgi:hypothetical protein
MQMQVAMNVFEIRPAAVAPNAEADTAALSYLARDEGSISDWPMLSLHPSIAMCNRSRPIGRAGCYLYAQRNVC